MITRRLIFTSSQIFSSPLFFFFNDTATTEIYTLSLHDALPISEGWARYESVSYAERERENYPEGWARYERDRKSTRLNSSHGYISYAVFCLKKKKHSASDHYIHDYVPYSLMIFAVASCIIAGLC